MFALFVQNQQFQAAVREHQRRARDAACQSVRESSEKNEFMMVQGIQTVQGHHEERLEERRDMLYKEGIRRRKMLNMLKVAKCHNNSTCLFRGENQEKVS